MPGAIGKAGAEACYAVALPDGAAIALKIDDGARAGPAGGDGRRASPGWRRRQPGVDSPLWRTGAVPVFGGANRSVCFARRSDRCR